MSSSSFVRLGALCALLGIAGCQPSSKDAEPSELKASLTVETITPTVEQWPRRLEASGKISPWEEAIIGAQVAGLPLVSIDAEVGDYVNKGAVLARFDDRTLKAELNQAEAALLQARAEARQAELNKERALKLQGSGTLSEQSVLQYVTGAEVAAAGVVQAEAAVASSRLRLSHARVTAPDTGAISRKTAQLGAVATPGQELFRMVRQGRLEWQAELTSSQLSQVKEGQKASIALPEGDVVEGRVRQISPALSEARMGIVYVDLIQPHSAKAAMYVSGAIQAEAAEVRVLPGSSIVVQDGRTHVFVLDEQAPLGPDLFKVKRIPVELGARKDGKVAVEGLPSGTVHVVKDGAGFLTEGDRVRRVNPSPAETQGSK
jgi:RND family efflux transporter MFP subunit